MTVELLRLSDLPAAGAEAAVEDFLHIESGPKDLTNLLVVDDTALLAEHEPVYIKIDNSPRTHKKLCIAVGPRDAGSRKLRLPGNLAGMGIPVIWVSYPAGIDCRVALAAVALGHGPGKTNGLDLLIQILLDEEMFKKVLDTFAKVPHGIANPGMRLAGQDDEAATFAVALDLSIRALCGAGPGAEGAYRELIASAAHGASLAERGQLARYRDEVLLASESGGNRVGFGGRLRPGQSDLHTRLIEAGAALGDLRELVVRLLRNVNTVGELNDTQYKLIADAGIQFPSGPQAPASTSASKMTADQPPLLQTLAKSLQGGDALPQVSKRLTLTERELKHSGSASHLPEVDKCCPQSLVDRLSAPPARPSRRKGAETGPAKDLGQAAKAARALEELIVSVANREWSPARPSRAEVGRIRAALDGTSKALTEYAARIGGGDPVPGSRPARMAELLAPVLRDLVIQIVATETARPSANPLDALEAARTRTGKLIEEWVKQVQTGPDGLSAQPPFPSSGVPHGRIYAPAEDVTEIREALLYQPAEEMWQLCHPDDLKNVLNLAIRPEAVGFASRLNKDALATTVSRVEPLAWTSSGSNAGLLRLVSLRPEYLATGPAAADADYSPDPEPL